MMEEVYLQDWETLHQEIKKEFNSSDEIAEMVFHWLKRFMPSTLILDLDLTKQEGDQEAEKVQIDKTIFRKNSRTSFCPVQISSSSYHTETSSAFEKTKSGISSILPHCHSSVYRLWAN